MNSRGILSILGLLSFLLLVPHAFAQNVSLPDLSITVIEMTPRYLSYCVTYTNNLASLCPGTENDKRTPDVGERMKLTATVKNVGMSNSGNLSYQWIIGSASESLAYNSAIAPGESITLEKSFDFPVESTPITLKLTPLTTGEISTKNNTRTFRTDDKTLIYLVEKDLYDIFNTTENFLGTYSFEDWMQAHMEVFNDKIARSFPGVAPEGSTLRLRVDKIQVVDEADSIPGSWANRKEFDGRWQNTDADPTNQRGRDGAWQEYADDHIHGIDWGLVHEVAHQMGIIDLYRFNFNNDPPHNNGFEIKWADGRLVTTDDFLFKSVVFNPATFGLMGGGDVSPYVPSPNDQYFSAHTVAAAATSASYRRGFYGEYLYDTPKTTTVRILNAAGDILPYTPVRLFQKDPDSGVLDNVPEYSFTTNAVGEFLLPNRSAPAHTTITGHTLRDNPFGHINVVGQNGTMVAMVTVGNNQGVGVFLLHDLNIAYWMGSTEHATIDIKTSYTGPFPTAAPTIPPTVVPSMQPTVTSSPAPSQTPVPTATTQPSVTPNPCNVVGDLDCSGKVNSLDLTILLKDYGSSRSKADLDHSGSVNALDLTILLQNFGKLATTPYPTALPTKSAVPTNTPSDQFRVNQKTFPQITVPLVVEPT